MRLFLPALLALASCGSSVARVEVDPAGIQLTVRGQEARVRAVALAGNGKTLPEKTCAWTSSEPRVATVAARGNEATVTAAGSGSAAIRCRTGDAVGEVPVSVRLIGKVEVAGPPPQLELRDQPAPTALPIRALDEAGQPATPRRITTRCLDENVCRGDDRGQLWPVGAGTSRAVVEADGVRAELEVKVVDARTAAGKPRAVTGNPMLEYEKAAEIIQKEWKKSGRPRAPGSTQP
ncbi:MAG: hypothetical protein HZB56_18380 [Deltaproteobacteria bacterium]|nr:hypothetical protein [Deltaproteobacteria bacterium]